MEALDLKALLNVVDIVVIIAIIGITEGIKRALPESAWRMLPIVPLLLGLACGFFMTDPLVWRVVAKNAILYAGAAAIFYELARTTIFGKGAKAPSDL